ncbi:MAG TPA: hypothetical protein PKA53_13355 [Sphingobacterium sp.]|nr:hypothetical protein [Sphingobacterium sp.]
MKIWKHIYWTIVFYFLLLSCVNRENREQVDTVDTIENAAIQDSVIPVPIWEYDYDTDSVVRIGGVGEKEFSIAELVHMINTRYKNKVKIHLIKQQDDTVFIQIDSATYLTQQMGSAGARDFMTVATFTLTEAEGVEYVFFDFTEGDHAAPGVYHRAYFEKR